MTYSSATLHGRVNPHSQNTNYFFQYGTTRAYGAQTPPAPAGSGATGIAVSETIAGLQSGIIYHYRIVAVSSAGTAKGIDASFTTPKVPLSVQIAGSPNPVVFGSPFLLEGTLSGTGAANHEIVLQANPFPYLAGFKSVGNPIVTSSTGGFSFPVTGLLENAQLRVVTVGKPAVTSSVVSELVAVRVTFHARRTRRRGFVRFYGTVIPAEVGAAVGLQLLKPGHGSVNEGGTLVKVGSSAVSRFSRVIRIRKHGLYRALIKVNDGAHASNYSTPVLVR